MCILFLMHFCSMLDLIIVTNCYVLLSPSTISKPISFSLFWDFVMMRFNFKVHRYKAPKPIRRKKKKELKYIHLSWTDEVFLFLNIINVVFSFTLVELKKKGTSIKSIGQPASQIYITRLEQRAHFASSTLELFEIRYLHLHAENSTTIVSHPSTQTIIRRASVHQR